MLTIIYISRLQLILGCEMDLIRFPMDNQSCKITIESCKLHMCILQRLKINNHNNVLGLQILTTIDDINCSMDKGWFSINYYIFFHVMMHKISKMVQHFFEHEVKTWNKLKDKHLVNWKSWNTIYFYTILVWSLYCLSTKRNNFLVKNKYIYQLGNVSHKYILVIYWLLN